MNDSVAPLYGIIDPDYARVFTIARTLAWSEGYALLFHGSFTRDLDLIAVPWTKSACEPEHLVRRVVQALDDLDLLQKSNPEETERGSPKEHGRLAWTLVFKAFGDPRFVDFSIMPRATHPQPAAGERASAIMAWLREPDYAEEFSLAEAIDWMNRRPIAELQSILSL